MQYLQTIIKPGVPVHLPVSVHIKIRICWDFSGGPVVKTVFPLQGAQVQSREHRSGN